jgi:hypothetical protein
MTSTATTMMNFQRTFEGMVMSYYD